MEPEAESEISQGCSVSVLLGQMKGIFRGENTIPASTVSFLGVRDHLANKTVSQAQSLLPLHPQMLSAVSQESLWLSKRFTVL